MTHSRDDLVALLHDYADVDPNRPLDVSEGVARRIARRRRRRVAYAASAAAAVIAVVLGLVQLVPRPTPPSPAGLALPAPVFTDNGVTYTRVAVVYLDTAKHRSVAVSIPGGDSPVAVFASCKLADPHSKRASAVALTTVAGYASGGGEFSCNDGRQHVTQVGRAALPAGGTRVRFAVVDSYADAPADAAASWAFAVYATTMPASVGSQAKPPAKITIPDAPSAGLVGGTYSLVHTYSGFWPAQRSVQVTIPSGAASVVVFQCPAPLAGRSIQLPGTTDGTYINAGSLTCLAPGQPPTVTADVKGSLQTSTVAQLGEQRPPPVSTPAPTTFTLTLDPSDQTHPGLWTIAVYQR